METVRSADGTTIAFERAGSGPALIMVGGAFNDHTTMTGTAALLADRFTTYCYDRRGRGSSGDTPPYAVEREVEDLAALVAHAGGEAALFGHSSGGVLVLQAAARGLPITRLAVYEPSYIVGTDRPRPPADMAEQLEELVAAGRPADAARLFLSECAGVPAEVIDMMQGSPDWEPLEALAPTLSYDVALHGPGQSMTDVLATIGVPSLVLAGGAGEAWMQNTARAVAAAVPGARLHTIEGEDHAVLHHPEVLAPVLAGFLGG
ncbi:alpha/beta hydrolase [Pseudonocardia yunnanensis]|uniref:Alpha/beta fold hydrolase n=1 Tax=Pseudonocardia yunnanensis TaxID=58107 RepID=A0ABW4EPF5_9PSEU